MFTLKGRTMVITGSAGNNGLAMINAALEAGMNVAFLSGFHSKAQAAIAKLDPKYKDQVIGFAQNPQAQLQANMEAAPDIYNENSRMLQEFCHFFAQQIVGVGDNANGHVLSLS